MIDPAGVRARAKVLAALRRWFEDQGYLEVPTPVLVSSGAMEENLHPFSVGDLYLRTSPEFALKKVVAAGLPRIYEIAPCFRDRERGAWHRPEFLMLEWYRVGASLVDLQQEVQQLVAVAAAALGVDPPKRWTRTTMHSLFLRHGVDLHTATISDLSPSEDSWDHAFFRRWVEDVEPSLTGATFVEDWPASQAALATIRTDGHPRAERFEVFVNGVELANAFHELRNPVEQRRRFEHANHERIAAGEPHNPIDPEFIAAVARLPPTSGIALGLERLVTVLLKGDDIGAVCVGS